jgi:hypothetical protein
VRTPPVKATLLVLQERLSSGDPSRQTVVYSSFFLSSAIRVLKDSLRRFLPFLAPA